jgi:Phage major capsid protein E
MLRIPVAAGARAAAVLALASIASNPALASKFGLSAIHNLTPGQMYAMAGNMLTMDVFKQDAFSAVNLTAAIDKEGFVPQMLGTIPNLFIPPPLGQPHSKAIFVEVRDKEPMLIQTSPRGTFPDDGRTDEKTRAVIPFVTRKLFRKRRIEAAELAGIRAFGTITEVQSLEMMVQRLTYLIQRDMALTWENMRLGTVQGMFVDADGTILQDYTQAFGQPLPAEVTFTFPATANGAVRAQCTQIKRAVTRALKGLGGTGVAVHAIASDSWWDAFISSAEVRTTYQAQEALRLQEDVTWSDFSFGGITFHNYRGTDDASTVAVPDKKVKFFPVGAGVFQRVQAPADERFEFVDTVGQDAYTWVVVDPYRNSWADVEMASYPLFMCTMPSALQRGTI